MKTYDGKNITKNHIEEVEKGDDIVPVPAPPPVREGRLLLQQETMLMVSDHLFEKSLRNM